MFCVSEKVSLDSNITLIFCNILHRKQSTVVQPPIAFFIHNYHQVGWFRRLEWGLPYYHNNLKPTVRRNRNDNKKRLQVSSSVWARLGMPLVWGVPSINVSKILAVPFKALAAERCSRVTSTLLRLVSKIRVFMLVLSCNRITNLSRKFRNNSL